MPGQPISTYEALPAPVDNRTILDLITERETQAHEVLKRCELAKFSWPTAVLSMKVEDFNKAGFYI